MAELIKASLDTVESFSIEEVEDVNEIVLPLVLTPEELVAVTFLVTAQGDDDNIVPLSGVNPVNEEYIDFFTKTGLYSLYRVYYLDKTGSLLYNDPVFLYVKKINPMRFLLTIGGD